MTDLHARFVALHRADAPLLLANAWDAASARLWQEAGAAAVATSSAAVAWSFGHADGGALPRADLLASLRNVVRVTSVPVTIDIEDGYSDDPREVAVLAQAVAAAGAVGINIEDGDQPPDRLAAKIRAIRDALGAQPLFVNARTDVHLRGMANGHDAVAMTIERMRLYRDAGADGGFVPGLTSAADAAAIAAAVPLAINVMRMPGLASLDALAAAGVRRISSGSAQFTDAYAAGLHAARDFLRGQVASAADAPPVDPLLGYSSMNRMFAPA